MPEDLGVAVFKMIYKRKGSSDDPSKYRCIGLLNSAYKVLSAIMLKRITAETQGYLKDWQAGFRQKRGCRDNVMILRTAVSKMLQENKPMVITFIDYSAAFDSVGHKFLDKALGEAKARPKTRAIFRSIYRSATARTKVKGTDGQSVLSAKFPVRRGVIQGDLTSPIYFIIALEAILRRYDNINGKGIDFGGARLHTLGYADDAALIDANPAIASARVTSIAQGSKRDADMKINISKTECMHVKRQQAVETPSSTEAEKVCKYRCTNIGCGWVFGNKLGLKIHQGKWCKWSNYYQVENILDVDTQVLPVGLGPTKFKIKWQGYTHDADTWEPYANVTKRAITEFLKTQGKYDYSWKHRCPRCDKPCKSAHGVKIHYARSCKRYDRDQRYEGTVAERLHTIATLKVRQKNEEAVVCEGEKLKNSYHFKYLGSMFAADGSDTVDLRRRIGMAMSRCGQLRFVLDSGNIKLSTKLKIYRCAVGSLFTYGNEAWRLTEANLRKLNGANASCLHRFTGKSRIEESRRATCTYSLCDDIRRRRMTWLGHILRMQKEENEERLVKIAAKVQFDMGGTGDLFMDAPTTQSFEEAEELAQNRAAWRRLVDAKFGPRTRRSRKKKRTKRKPKVTIPHQQSQKARLPPPKIKTTITAERAGNMIQSELPPAWQPAPSNSAPSRTTKSKLKAPCNNKQSSKEKKKITRLTDAQRAAWAHAHFIVNHGTNLDAAKFLTHKKIVAQTPAEDLHKIRVMARRRVPTWQQAEAAVFSSSESSEESAEPITRDPAPPNTARETTEDEPPKAIQPPTTTPTSSNPKSSPNNGHSRPIVPTARRYNTRSVATRARKLAAEDKDAAGTTPPSIIPTPKPKPRRKGHAPKPSKRPKRVRIAPSKIPGAGMGLYLLEDAEKGECIARYSGDPLAKAECDQRKHSQYRMQVHRNLFLDAENQKHFEGRYINDARHSKYKVNARFAANYAINICSITGFSWVRIYATRKIKAGEEILIDYGDDFWAFITAAQQNSPLKQLATTITPSSSLWAAPAPFPDSSQPSMDSQRWAAPAQHAEPPIETSPPSRTKDDSNTTKLPTHTMIWPIQVPAPSSPTILGYINPTLSTDLANIQHIPHFPQHLSPVKLGPSPNLNQYMNENFSLNQMYDLNDTLLLPTHITNPNTQHDI